MKANFNASMTEVLRWEGGFVDHPRDPGGATNMGITIGTLSSWRKKPVTKADVRALSRREALDIYRDKYADVIRYDDLPAGLDHITLDPAINSGPARGVTWLQQAMGVSTDGKMGPTTLRAAKAARAEFVITRACQIRMGFLRGLKTWGSFGKGWSRRVAGAEAFALALAIGAPATRAKAADADAQARREVAKATGATTGGAGSISLADLPDWSIWVVMAAVIALVIVLIGQRRHEMNRAAAFRAIGG